ncbi:MAG: alpha/beta fold hydrolase [Segniliparus sp.]|uniref:alpha/beta fold hydrolase n=1 Tax=Segniliparus sp. TaxID=2804064 RepID=UPI003F2E43C9
MNQSPNLPGVEHRWVEANGIRFHVAEAGHAVGAGAKRPGKAVVLVHGFPQHWWTWRGVIPLLAEHRHVVALDLRGHGWSDVPDEGYDKKTLARDIVAAVAALGLDKPVLVGHDWGGWSSLVAASLHPEAFTAVASVAVPAPWSSFPAKRPRALLYQDVLASALGPWLIRAGKQRFLRLLYSKGVVPGSRTEENVEVFLERYRDPARAAAGSALYRTFVRSEWPELAAGTYVPGPPPLPTLLVRGAQDQLLGERALLRAGQAGADISFHTIDGGTHWLPEEQPEALAERLLAFAGTVDPQFPN